MSTETNRKEVAMSELLGDNSLKKDSIKELIKRLHRGENPEKLKEEFKDILKGLAPQDIAKIEEELVKEGISSQEIRKMCDIHLAVFRETLEKQKPEVPPWHPVYILMEEHKKLLDFVDKLRNTAKSIKNAGKLELTALERLNHIAEHFKESESHYQREENVLFPYLEKHGITQPPAIMWMEHDKIRESKKNLYKLVKSHSEMDFDTFITQLENVSLGIEELLSSHFYKENNVLFPTGLKVIEDTEWLEIRQQFDEMGYCCFTPEPAKTAVTKKVEEITPKKGDMIDFNTGNLSKQEIEAIFNTLPVDITFVDKDDTVRYFSETKERIFPRTKAVIGRKVQQCHPEKSVHIVNKILADFKSGKRDHADFWINLMGRLIYIRYFAVHGKNGEYLGCLEVTQDITDIKKLEGEKRLYEDQK